MMRRWHLALLAIAAVLLFGLVLAITAPDPAADAKDMPELILRYAENQPEGYPTTEAAYAFADLVEEKTGGRVQIRVYSNGVLGSEDSVVEQMEYGGIDFSRISVMSLGEFMPELYVLQLPFLYKDSDHMWRVLDGPIGETFLASIQDSIGLTALTWFDAGVRHFYTNEPVTSLDDLKGLYIRVAESSLMEEIIQDLGAVPVRLAYDDVYSALAKEDIDGAENNWPSYDYTGQNVDAVSSACDTYTLAFTPMTDSEIQEEQFWEQVEQGIATWDDYYLQDFWLTYQGENPRKCLLLFGDQNKRRFASQAEAEASMTTVIIPVWKLVNGQKAASTMSLAVHSAIAQDVVEIFTEIYNDPEQFPIHDVGGYSWRGDTATGEHNCGTAIDINANENYQIRDGQVLAGSCWEPETNPYSISPDSSVVRIFAEHGWSWGGDAWAYSSDDAEGYHDYMHFSYLGE